MGTEIALWSFVLLVVALPFFLQWLAQQGILVTFVQEGTLKIVLSGDSFHHILMSYKGHHLNDPHKPWYDAQIPAWEILPHAAGEDAAYDRRPWLARVLGIYWVGLPPFRKIRTYHFDWTELAIDRVSGKEILRTRSEMTDFAFASDFPYVQVIAAAETGGKPRPASGDGESNLEGGNLKVDAIFVTTVAITNAYKAFYGTEDWMKRLNGAVIGTGRSFIGRKSYEQLRSETDEEHTGDDNMPDAILRQAEKLADICGVTVKECDVQSIELVGASKELQDATTQIYVAQQTSRAAIIEGTGKAEALRLQGEAEAQVIRMKGEAHAQSLKDRLAALREQGALGELMLQTDAMASDGPGKTVIWANNPFVQSVPGLSAALEAAGIKTPEQLQALVSQTQAKEAP